MRPWRQIWFLWGPTAFALLLSMAPARLPAQSLAANLPRYDFDIRIDPEKHLVEGHQRVQWTNRQPEPCQELIFNVFSHYKLSSRDADFAAKMLEIGRLSPNEAIDYQGEALRIHKITAPSSSDSAKSQELAFAYRGEAGTILAVRLPQPVQQGQTVTVDIAFTLRLPQIQGRCGQWKDVISLTSWHPVLAYYDEQGWQPTPFVFWHPADFNEAGIYSARVTMPKNMNCGCTCSPTSVVETGDGRKRLEFAARPARNFALTASARYRELTAEASGVRVRCLAFAEHAHYAQSMMRTAAEALAAYSRWFGPYPYSEFTIVEAFPGWGGQTCAGMIVMDERVFEMPHSAAGVVEVIVAEQTCRQWWYNQVGTNGYSETWMDEGLAHYFAHRLLDQKLGKHSDLLRWSPWLPQVDRATFRQWNLYGTLGRGEQGPTVQDIPKFGHCANLTGLVCERGGKIVGMIEQRMGEEAFLRFMRGVQERYAFRMLRVADFQRELETFTGNSWDTFFRNWLYGGGTTDWLIEDVQVRREFTRGADHGFAATVLLRQDAEHTEPTVLGICLDKNAGYAVRIPIDPDTETRIIDRPEGKVERLSANRFRVQVHLPSAPTQIAVDPDQVLVDREPANNFWKPEVRFRVLPLYTMLEETDLTCAHDHWNVLAGPWLTDTAYNDPWFSYSSLAGVRLGAFRTQQFQGGLYAGYRPDFRDLAVGADILRDHWPWPKTQVGFNFEKRLATFDSQDRGPDRGVLYGRYIIDETDSLYQQPMHFIELFGSRTDNLLPTPRTPPGSPPLEGGAKGGAERFPIQNSVGVQYHINYLTPYWDPEGGFQFDATYGAGIPIWGQHRMTNQATAQLSFVQEMPDDLGWLNETRLAYRLFGAAGLPGRGQLFSLGGNQLFRGFDMAERQGSMAWIASAEWRVPVAKGLHWDAFDHTVGIRNIYVAPFYDVGSIYSDRHSVGGIAHAVGAGLRLDLAWFGFVERTIFRFDAAKTINSSAPVQFWFGIEHPF